jgi:hypothetical protein
VHKDSGKNLCLFNILDGLSEGLSQFSGPSRAAVLYAERPEDPMRIYDPQDLLRGHEPKLEELYLQSNGWRTGVDEMSGMSLYGQIQPEKNLDLAGLISFGGRTRSIFYQMWFTEHHLDMCSTGPTERWLEHAAFLLSHDFAFEESLYAGTSGYVLREYATHAVRDIILDEFNIMLGWDERVFVYPTLNAVLVISKTPEEGSWPRGNLVFIEKRSLPEVNFLTRFPELQRPMLRNFKHVRKLLQAVERTDRKLIAAGKNVIGIAAGELPRVRLTADFRGGYGFVRLAGKPVCSFSDGRFYSSNRTPNLVDLEEILIESPLDSASSHLIFRSVTEIVRAAAERKFGCTLVIDLNDQPIGLSGQGLEQPVDLGQPHFLELAKSLAKLDGALHISADNHLHRFSCLLDGTAVPGEDLSRGARYNSALRFTSNRKNLVVVVVSADQPVSVIQGGVVKFAQCQWKPVSQLHDPPMTLEAWCHA